MGELRRFTRGSSVTCEWAISGSRAVRHWFASGPQVVRQQFASGELRRKSQRLPDKTRRPAYSASNKLSYNLGIRDGKGRRGPRATYDEGGCHVESQARYRHSRAQRDFTGASLGGHYAQCGQGAGTGRIRRGRSSEALHWRQLSRAAGGQPHGRADRARRHSGQRPVGAFHPPVIPRQRHHAYRPGSS